MDTLPESHRGREARSTEFHTETRPLQLVRFLPRSNSKGTEETTKNIIIEPEQELETARSAVPTKQQQQQNQIHYSQNEFHKDAQAFLKVNIQNETNYNGIEPMWLVISSVVAIAGLWAFKRCG
ncbi:hypothetical protein F5B20DRAFT_577787 [Whalleya microplaca]|nr:hypothetical protein F5B20DRAFT_577787 [Whalleya microplaca]